MSFVLVTHNAINAGFRCIVNTFSLYKTSNIDFGVVGFANFTAIAWPNMLPGIVSNTSFL